MASECRPPKLKRDQRPCLNCNKPGHNSANGPDRRAPIEALITGEKPVVVLCCEDVDKDGFRLVRQRPRRHGQISGDFIKPPTTTKTTATTTTTTRSHNRYRALTVADLSDIAAVVSPPDVPLSPVSFASSSCFQMILRFLHLRVKRGAPLV